MKRAVSFFLILTLIFLSSGCAETNNGKYKNALDLLGVKSTKILHDEDAEIPDDFISPKNKDDIKPALEILAELGDYKDSILLINAVNNIRYNEAVSLFTEGKFEEAKNIFSALDKDFEYTERYLSSIEVMSKTVGFWSADYGDNKWNLVFVDITGPFEVGPSEYSDCDWSVTANIEIDVHKLEYEEQTFSIRTRAGFHHTKENNVLNESIFIDHDKFDQQIFDVRKSGWSKIALTPKGGMMDLVEFVYNADRTKLYSSNSVMLDQDVIKSD